MTYEASIAALADPTRRQIVARLQDGAKCVGHVAAGLNVSRPAVSQHLRILADAGLVTVTPQGTRRLYALAPGGADSLQTYLHSLWPTDSDTRLAAAPRIQHPD